MDTIELQIDNAPNIRFYGERLGNASSRTRDSKRWTVLELYKTAGGKYICCKEGHSLHDGEYKKTSGAVAETPQQVIDFFGHSLLAKSLYAAAGINDVLIID